MLLYIHIPYCRQKCRYCDFASYAGQESTMSQYVEALLREADAYGDMIGKIDTVFIGGGTPSILPADLLDKLLGGLHERLVIPAGVEFTTEANPGTLTEAWLDAAVSNGVNRVSMGMQAAQPNLLERLGRIHTMDDVVSSMQLLRKHGIVNTNLDLMFGLPGQTLSMWLETLDAALSLSPEHLSCYGLIPEDGTPLKRDIDAGRLNLPDEDVEREMYDRTLRTLASHGYCQYEISNFARPGFECRHNVGYWQQVPYVGLGVSAASMLPHGNGELRTTNPTGIRHYLQMVHERNWEIRTQEAISPADARFETLMLGLRMTEGVSEAEFAQRHGIALSSYRGKKLKWLADHGLLVNSEGRWRLTREGMDVQNSVLVELMDE